MIYTAERAVDEVVPDKLGAYSGYIDLTIVCKAHASFQSGYAVK